MGEGRVGEVCKRCSPPHVQGAAKPLRGTRGVAAEQGVLPGFHLPLESIGVESLGLDDQRIAAGAGRQHLAGSAARAFRLQCGAQPRDVHLQGVGGSPRRPAVPNLFDQQIGGDRLVGVDQEDPQQGPLLRRIKGQGMSPVTHFQRSQYSEFHLSPWAGN